MTLIQNWRKAYRMISVQAMGLAMAIQGAWMTLTDEMKATIPPNMIFWITMGLLAFGTAGRLVTQKKVHQ